MPEPTSTALTTVTAAAAVMPAITAFGVPLGLRPDLLVAGFSGSLVAIILLNAVPGTGDTWRELLRTTLRRIAVAVASSLTAGYLTPMVGPITAVPDQWLLGGAFATGAGAQHVLMAAIRRFSGKVAGEAET